MRFFRDNEKGYITLSSHNYLLVNTKNLLLRVFLSTVLGFCTYAKTDGGPPSSCYWGKYGQKRSRIGSLDLLNAWKHLTDL